MTPSEAAERNWVRIELRGYRICRAAGCSRQILRITRVHPRKRDDPDGLAPHVAPLPLSHRCYSCAAEMWERERQARMI